MTNGGETLVSPEDFDRLSEHSWHRSVKGYAVRKRGTVGVDQVDIYMHREIVDAPLVDHVNGDRLDNRRSNLRPTTRSQNMANLGRGPRGVRQHTSGKWIARIGFEMKRIYLGVYETKELAEAAYVKKAKELFGSHWS